MEPAPTTSAEAAPALSTPPARASRAGSVAALCRLTVLEGARGSFLPAALVVLTVLMALLPKLVLFSFGEERRMASELGLANLRFAAILVALDAALRAARDREHGALATFLARPLGVPGYVAARFVGSLGLLGVLLLTLSAARALTLKPPFDVPAALSAAAARTLLEGAVLIAAGGLAGALLRPAGAAAATAAVFVLGHVGPYAFAEPVAESGGASALAALAAALLPDLGAIGPPDGLRPDPGHRAAFALALAPTVAYLCGAIGVGMARELEPSGQRGAG